MLVLLLEMRRNMKQLKILFLGIGLISSLESFAGTITCVCSPARNAHCRKMCDLVSGYDQGLGIKSVDVDDNGTVSNIIRGDAHPTNLHGKTEALHQSPLIPNK